MRSRGRNTRIKTDYSQKESSSSSYMSELKQYFKTPSSSSANKNDRPSILSRVHNQINHEVNYEQLTSQDIVQQRNLLNRKMKEMNSALAKLIQTEMQRRNEEERISSKAVINRQMGFNYQQLCREHVENTNKIRALEEQFNEVNQKLIMLSDPDSKLHLAKKVAQNQLKIKQIKEQLGRIRKNKFLREKQIVKGTESDKNELQALQAQYITLSKKTSYLSSRSQKVQEELADCEFSQLKLKDYFEQLKAECQEIDNHNPSPALRQHLKVLYDSHRKKLSLHQRRYERDEQTKKRRYYNLLVQFDEVNKKSALTQEKINQREDEVEQSAYQIKELIDELRRVKEAQQAEQMRKKQSLSGFMMTEVPKQRFSVSTGKAKQLKPNNTKIAITKQKRKSIMDSPMIRRWNSRVLGSIIRQPRISQYNIQSVSETQQDRNSCFSQSKHRPKNHSLLGHKGKIKHFQTEATPLEEEFSDVISEVHSPMHQDYPSDFQA